MSDAKKPKPRRAVLVSVTKQGDEFRLSLDDVECQRSAPTLWKQRDHVTSKEISERAIEELEFDEKELADIGHYILARLHAFKSRGEI
jgi:hypothetical protein